MSAAVKVPFVATPARWEVWYLERPTRAAILAEPPDEATARRVMRNAPTAALIFFGGLVRDTRGGATSAQLSVLRKAALLAWGPRPRVEPPPAVAPVEPADDTEAHAAEVDHADAPAPAVDPAPVDDAEQLVADVVHPAAATAATPAPAAAIDAPEPAIPDAAPTAAPSDDAPAATAATAPAPTPAELLGPEPAAAEPTAATTTATRPSKRRAPRPRPAATGLDVRLDRMVRRLAADLFEIFGRATIDAANARPGRRR